jgi:hypothetical protein
VAARGFAALSCGVEIGVGEAPKFKRVERAKVGPSPGEGQIC